MARKIFVAATGKDCGKTTTSLSLLHLASKKYGKGRVGFMKPFGPKPAEYRGVIVDKDAALTAEIFGLEQDPTLLSPVVVDRATTRAFLDGEFTAAFLHEKIRSALDELEHQYDFIVIEGSGHGGVGSIFDLSNAEVARITDAPVMIVTGGGIGNVVDATALNIALFRQAGVEVKLVLTNKVDPAKREQSLHYLTLAFARIGVPVRIGFDYAPLLANPTLNRVAKVLGETLRATPQEAQRIILHQQLGAASSQRVIDLLEDSTLLMVNSSRDELLVTTSSLYHLPEYKRKIAGLLIAGLNPISKITQQIIDDSGVPYLRTMITNSETFTLLSNDVSKTTADDKEKIELIYSMAERQLDFDAIEALVV
ncbi:MAG: cobyrinic acid a,c-diamide synthase [Deltaproteobacteria bacterium HGW-Deltaproteobacteria-4]|nr:MAG: cobyrinic acid a,c-diamide synthase [Deltaproteobacteria bacterium HGW-Deltaproteobacteria-4]